MQNKKLYLNLFLKNFYISAFTFGGGYVVIPMLKKYFVEDVEYLSNQELMALAAIAQSSPGAIAVNLSVLVGYKVGKIKGALITCVATILPPLIILSIVSLFYAKFRSSAMIAAILKGMEAGVAATIVSLVFEMSVSIIQEEGKLTSSLIVVAFGLNYFFNINVIIIIIGAIGLSVLQILFKQGLKWSI